MAGLTPRSHNLGGFVAAALLATAATSALAISVPAAAADPTPAPGPSTPPSCAERFPAEGPAGVDLRLGCIVGELVGLYTASSGAAPAPISTYAIALAVAIMLAALLVWSARTAARRAGRRLAPVLPGRWWVCDRCRSVNVADATRCYACGAPPSAGPALQTSEKPETPQSFGDRGVR